MDCTAFQVTMQKISKITLPVLTRKTLDISPLSGFSWYTPVYFAEKDVTYDYDYLELK